MSEPSTNVPVLEYGKPEPRATRTRRRVLYCVGLPILAFALAGGVRRDIDSVIAAVGALFVAFALPIGERE